MSDNEHPSRRQVVAGAVATAVATTLGVTSMASEENHMPSRAKMPTVYLPHGGGPFSYVDLGVPAAEVDALAAYWRGLGRLRPKALLVISAHWEESIPTVMTSPRPPMLYDYYGFPQAAYEIQWPAPGDPALARRVGELLEASGIDSAVDGERGFDHGTFVPLKRSFPEADVPCVQLSLTRGLDPEEHLRIGRALAPLREEGVLIVGSGLSYHNQRGFMMRETDADADAFDAWLQQTTSAPQGERDQRLTAWEAAPSARRVHPREEHLLPLMVVAGAAGDDAGSIPFNGKLFGKKVSAVHFG